MEKGRRATAGMERWRRALLALVSIAVVGFVVRTIDAERGQSGVPREFADAVLERFADSRHVILVGDSRCGSPFRTALNYLYRSPADSIAVVSGTQEYQLLRGLRKRGVRIAADDRLIARALEYGDLIVLSRPTSGAVRSPVVSRFGVAPTGEILGKLESVLGRRVPAVLPIQ